MAVRKGKAKTPAKKQNTNPKKKPWGAIFWLGFFVLVFGLFLINRERIHNSIESIRRQTDSRPGGPDLADETRGEDETPEQTVPGLADTEPAARDAPEPPETPAAPQAPAAPQPRPAAAPPEPPPVQADRPARPAAAPAPPAQAGESPPARTPAARPVTPAPETRERPLYFTQVDREGAILRVKVMRKLPVSDSPMVDSLTALINGPSTDEQRRGLISLIPKETGVLNATVRGSTAYISLSEDFQLNTHGVEGYAASLRQIVWTVTEFPNVKDVQILIEGRRLDYLGEGIWIGSPLNRETVP